MEVFKTVCKANMPKTRCGRSLTYAAGGLLALGLLYYPYSLYQWNTKGYYRETVCWEPYRASMRAIIYTAEYSDSERKRLYRAYKECIANARYPSKGKKE